MLIIAWSLMTNLEAATLTTLSEAAADPPVISPRTHHFPCRRRASSNWRRQRHLRRPLPTPHNPPIHPWFLDLNPDLQIPILRVFSYQNK
jgi:hypothetical protein